MKTLLERFKAHLEKEKLWSPGERWLVAASGGIDSTVLCQLLASAGIPFAVAHCNFQLRGEDSDGDEIFVKNLAEQLGAPSYSTRFETQKYASEQRLSTQEAARNLRYTWFREIMQVSGCQRIATAHHLGDSVETLLFNLARGCGIRGLHGIQPLTHELVRPLLFATKKELLEWAEEQQLHFREDASNATDKYARNLIRHQAVPLFERINPAFQKNVRESIGRFREAEALFEFALQNIHKQIVEVTPDGWRLDIQGLLSYPAPATVLFEWLRPFGFDEEQIRQVLQSVENQAGAVFHALSGRLLIDRFFMFFKVEGNVGGGISIPTISEQPLSLPGGGSLSFRQYPTRAGMAFPQDPAIACFDLDSLRFPLRLRRWQAGDSFQPLGMGGRRQKLQDFFSNRKLSRFEKEAVWLLESAGQICWILGMRLDERFKVVENAKTCLEVEFQRGTFAK